MRNNLKKEITEIAKQAKQASFKLALNSPKQRSDCILAMAAALRKRKDAIMAANRVDIQRAGEDKKNTAFIDRLRLDDARIEKMSASLRSIAGIKDYVGELIKSWRTEAGLEIRKVRVPIGVIAIIYESRPDVTSDCLGLCLKSANALILRGGSAAINSNIAIFDILKKVIATHGIEPGAFGLIKNTQRKSIDELLKLSECIDLVIPRGGEGLIKEVVKKSRIAVIKHYKGICAIYVDEAADINTAFKICLNAKVQRPGVCNAMETLLVHKKIASRFLPAILERFKEAKVEIRGTSGVRKFDPQIKRAKKSDFKSEFLDLILAVRIVGSLEEAIEHINTFGSHHSDAIITEAESAAKEFLNRIDSACVFVNTSTRFSDGYQFGMGAEMGISTDKIHARGPMAVEELMIYKYQVIGQGQIRK